MAARWLALLAALASPACPVYAGFGTVTADYNGFTGLAGTVTYQPATGGGLTTTGQIGAGRMNFNITNSTAPQVANVSGGLFFCIELGQTVVDPPAPYEVVSVADAPNPTRVQVPAPTLGANRAFYINELFKKLSVVSNPSNDQYAGMQLAIWEVAYESLTASTASGWDFNVSSGNGFLVASGFSTAAINYATTLLNDVNMLTVNGNPINVVAIVSSTIQDQVTYFGGAGVQNVIPEASALATWGLLAGVGSALRPRRR